MKPVATISTQPTWMQDPGLKSILDALGDGNALMVGGCVRMAVLNEPVPQTGMDIDIATVLTPDQVCEQLAAHEIRYVRMTRGAAHGTVTAIVNQKNYEITTLRQDVKTDGRHAEVTFTADWSLDAQRRDFTMNTLLMNSKGEVFDPTGQGLADLKAGMVRFVGDADARIAEDYLRILRFFRFHARYGKGQPDLDTLKACVRSADKIKRLSRERITQEYEKILRAKGAAGVIDIMRRYDVMPGVISDKFDVATFKELQEMVHWNPELADVKTLFAYSVWQNDIEKLLNTLDEYFIITNNMKAFLTKNIQFIKERTEYIEKNIYLFGEDVTLSGTVLLFFFTKKRPDIEKLKARLEHIVRMPVPMMPINGDDIMQLTGSPSGKQTGEILKKVEDWWLKEQMAPDREQTLEYARSVARDY
jgi:poly(A) polymerase